MLGGKGRIRRKNTGQDKDVSFRFHSGGSLKTGAYVSEGSRDSPVFSDSQDEQDKPKYVSTLQADSKRSSVTDGADDVEDQDLVRELLESAIDETVSDSTNVDQPLLSDPLFEFNQEPLTRPELDNKSDTQGKAYSIQTRPTKELEYEETFSSGEQQLDSEGFSDSGDFMNIKERGEPGSRPSEIHRLLDSDDEELFLSFTKEAITETTGDDKVTTEVDYVAGKDHELESEDTTLLAEVDTHPLIPTSSVEDDGEGELKDIDEHNYQLLLSEEHFSNNPALDESPEKNQNLKVKPKRPPPPRPPLPSKMGKPSIVVSGATNDPSPREAGWDDNDDSKLETFQETKSSATTDEEKIVQRDVTDESTEGGNHVPSAEVVRDDSLSLPYFVTYTMIVFLYYSLNPSSYLAGFLTGFLLFFVISAVGFIWYVNYLLLVQQQEREAVQKSLELSSQRFINQLDDQLYFKRISKFGIRFDYDPASHHYSDNTPAHVKLEGFILTLSIKKSSDSEEHAHQSSQTQDWVPHHTSSEIVKQLDLRNFTVSIIPNEIAHNRKRRWSKKFPICLSQEQAHHKNQTYFLFIPTAKSKEMWFRRMRSCSEGISDKQVAMEQNGFFSYMKHYMPKSIGDVEKLKPDKKKKKKGDSSTVHYSMKSHDESDEEEENSAVSITKQASATKAGRTKKSSIPPAMADMDWLNTALARICWDIWHEKRWHDWVEAKIQRRISRIKTPSWMEPLSVADIQLGKDVPIVKRIYAPPKLNSEGVWIYLAVQYKGSFTMTLETKLRLGKGPKDETDSQQKQPHVISGHSTSPKKSSDRYRKPQLPSRQVSSSVDPDDADGNQMSSLDNSTEEQLTFIHKRSMPRSISLSSSIISSTSRHVNTGTINGDSDLDSGSDDDGMSASSSLSSSPNFSHLDNSEIVNVAASVSAQTSYPSKPAKWKNMLDRLKNSTIVQKAANTRIVRMAAEKMSSYNLYLTVEVKALDGFLAVNMSPPPSDILWYGFQWKPRLDLSAKPKLGQREVTLHYVTEWIENKLKELLDKQMVLPNMESIAIPILNSGIAGDVPYKLPRLSSNPQE